MALENSSPPFVDQDGLYQEEEQEEDDLSSASSLETPPNPSEMALDTLEAVSEAIEVTKNAVLNTDGGSEARKELVRKLVRLRMRYHDLDEGERLANGPDAVSPVDVDPFAGLETRGHRFIPYGQPYTDFPNWHNFGLTSTSMPRRPICQRCGYAIWLGLQSSYHCL